MPLSPERLRQIEEEERLRIESELGRARSSRTRQRPAVSNGIKLAALFLLGFALASVVIAWQWRSGDDRAPDARRARTPDSQQPAVFGEKPAKNDESGGSAPAAEEQSRRRSETAPAAEGARPLPNDPALFRQTEAAVDEPRRPTPVTRVNEVPADIAQFVERWEHSLENRDLETQAACYAPVVERFYTKSNVRLKDVIAEKRRMLEAYPTFNKYEIRNIRVESLTPERASITFDKDWDTSGKKRFAGSEQQRLVLRKIGGEWKIAREVETRVYWVRRS